MNVAELCSTDITSKELRKRFMEIHLMNGSKWRHKHVNKKFLKSLKETYGLKTFTNRDAYVVYIEKGHLTTIDIHTGKLKRRLVQESGYSVYDELIHDEPWMAMNVRNTLCAAVCYKEYGLLRMGMGKYRFIK